MTRMVPTGLPDLLSKTLIPSQLPLFDHFLDFLPFHTLEDSGNPSRPLHSLSPFFTLMIHAASFRFRFMSFDLPPPRIFTSYIINPVPLSL